MGKAGLGLLGESFLTSEAQHHCHQQSYLQDRRRLSLGGSLRWLEFERMDATS